MFLSLDGVCQASGEPGEDRSDGFDQGGWQVPYVDEDMMKLIAQWFGAADAFLFGRKTYEIFAGYWPQVTEPTTPIANQLNSRRKYVASRTLQRAIIYLTHPTLSCTLESCPASA
jgi:dihydrofolate reductase